MRKLLGSLVLSLGLGMGTANAAEVAKVYFGAGFSDGRVEVTDGSDRSFGTANVTVGAQLLDFIGVELEAGAASDQVGSMISQPQVQYAAAMVRLGYRWDRAGIYVLGGQANLDVVGSLGNEDDGLVNAMGLGVNLFGNKTTALNFHVLRLGDGKFTTATVGFQYYFGGFR